MVEGHEPQWSADAETFYMGVRSAYCFLSEYAPSTDWAQGGPIIEREGIDVMPMFHFKPTGWQAQVPGTCYSGPTPLIAAMRCFVASKLGDEVDVPAEVLQ